MSVMSTYFQSLDRAADLACMVSKTLEQHPGAVVKYNDESLIDDLIESLSDSEKGIHDTSHTPQNRFYVGEPVFEEEEPSNSLTH